MAKQKIKELQELARNMVGDSKKPNLFFVTIEGVVVTVTRNFSQAYDEWQWLDQNTESAIEDRSFGTICSREPSEDGTRMDTWDESDSFL